MWCPVPSWMWILLSLALVSFPCSSLHCVFQLDEQCLDCLPQNSSLTTNTLQISITRVLSLSSAHSVSPSNRRFHLQQYQSWSFILSSSSEMRFRFASFFFFTSSFSFRMSNISECTTSSAYFNRLMLFECSFTMSFISLDDCLIIWMMLCCSWLNVIRCITFSMLYRRRCFGWCIWSWITFSFLFAMTSVGVGFTKKLFFSVIFWSSISISLQGLTNPW